MMLLLLLLLGIILTKVKEGAWVELMMNIEGKIGSKSGSFRGGLGRMLLGPTWFPIQVFESDPSKHGTFSWRPWEYPLLQNEKLPTCTIVASTFCMKSWGDDGVFDFCAEVGPFALKIFTPSFWTQEPVPFFWSRKRLSFCCHLHPCLHCQIFAFLSRNVYFLC